MDWLTRLRRQGYLVSDGAWGTQLAARGLPAGYCPELWNVEQPEVVRTLAAEYAEAGSDLVLTNSFGGSRCKLGKCGLAGRVEELNRRAAELSVEGAAGRAAVLGAMGPLGEFIEPLGDLSRADAVAAFAEQARGLAAGGVDGFVIETMTALEEALAAL